MCPSVLLISPATPSSRPCSCDSIGQSLCNCCIPSDLPSLVWSPVLFLSTPPVFFLLSRPACTVCVSPQSYIFPCLYHFTCYPSVPAMGFCFPLIDLLLFLLPHIIYRLLPLCILRSVLVQSSLVHQSVLCCSRCRCIVRYSTRSISSLFPPFLV